MSTMMRVNADIIIKTDRTPTEVCDALIAEAPNSLDDFELGEVVDFDIMSHEPIMDAEAEERGWS